MRIAAGLLGIQTAYVAPVQRYFEILARLPSGSQFVAPLRDGRGRTFAGACGAVQARAIERYQARYDLNDIVERRAAREIEGDFPRIVCAHIDHISPLDIDPAHFERPSVQSRGDHPPRRRSIAYGQGSVGVA